MIVTQPPSAKPDPNTYWVVPGKLLAGEYPGAPDSEEARRRLKRFLAAGVRHFIDLTEVGELEPYAELLKGEAGSRTSYQRIPIRDVSVPEEPKTVAEIIAAIDRAFAEGGITYIHCWGGVGRTGLAVACWLQERGLTPDEALKDLADKWSLCAKSKRKPSSPETAEQVRWVKEWPLHRSRLHLQLTRERYRGALLGLAAGDALGTTLEFKPPGTFAPLADMIGGGQFHLKPGEWTDDTSMALCLAKSLIEKRGFDAKDQMDRYCSWHEEGYLSSTGRCFDIGNTVRSALETYRRTGNPFSGSESPNAAGNGSLMRLAPIPLFFASNAKEAIHYASESSRTTHGTKAAVDACRYFAGLIVGALQGRSKEELLSPYFSPTDEPSFWNDKSLDPKIAAIAEGSFKKKDPPAIRGTGYVVDSLEAALWAFDRSRSFREGAILAVNLGDDADTTGAIYGQIAGALYGAEQIPPEWRAKLTMHDFIREKADQLFAIAQPSNPDRRTAVQ
jgi:ADP-ribosyl-[dinitrogen reductase] hydrolase